MVSEACHSVLTRFSRHNMSQVCTATLIFIGIKSDMDLIVKIRKKKHIVKIKKQNKSYSEIIILSQPLGYHLGRCIRVYSLSESDVASKGHKSFGRII